MIKNKEEVLEAMYEEIRKFCKIGVVGMSGGADSTLIATLLTQALRPENVYGVGMSYGLFDIFNFNKRSKQIADRLGINYKRISIRKNANEIVKSSKKYLRCFLNERFFKDLNKINKGNARSRARMCCLYAISHELENILKEDVRVIGTGNYSEDKIGYDTKFGDSAADCFPIGQLFKSEVYELLEYFVEKGILTKDDIDYHPSAGLWSKQYDEDELGYTYSEMEVALRRMFLDYDYSQFEVKNPIDIFVYNRWKNNKHKHEAPPVFELRKLIDGE